MNETLRILLLVLGISVVVYILAGPRWTLIAAALSAIVLWGGADVNVNNDPLDGAILDEEKLMARIAPQMHDPLYDKTLPPAKLLQLLKLKNM